MSGKTTPELDRVDKAIQAAREAEAKLKKLDRHAVPLDEDTEQVFIPEEDVDTAAMRRHRFVRDYHQAKH
jgi:hypothetical protein